MKSIKEKRDEFFRQDRRRRYKKKFMEARIKRGWLKQSSQDQIVPYKGDESDSVRYRVQGLISKLPYPFEPSKECIQESVELLQALLDEEKGKFVQTDYVFFFLFCDSIIKVYLSSNQKAHEEMYRALNLTLRILSELSYYLPDVYTQLESIQFFKFFDEFLERDQINSLESITSVEQLLVVYFNSVSVNELKIGARSIRALSFEVKVLNYVYQSEINLNMEFNQIFTRFILHFIEEGHFRHDINSIKDESHFESNQKALEALVQYLEYIVLEDDFIIYINICKILKSLNRLLLSQNSEDLIERILNIFNEVFGRMFLSSKRRKLKMSCQQSDAYFGEVEAAWVDLIIETISQKKGGLKLIEYLIPNFSEKSLISKIHDLSIKVPPVLYLKALSLLKTQKYTNHLDKEILEDIVNMVTCNKDHIELISYAIIIFVNFFDNLGALGSPMMDFAELSCSSGSNSMIRVMFEVLIQVVKQDADLYSDEFLKKVWIFVDAYSTFKFNVYEIGSDEDWKDLSTKSKNSQKDEKKSFLEEGNSYELELELLEGCIEVLCSEKRNVFSVRSRRGSKRKDGEGKSGFFGGSSQSSVIVRSEDGFLNNMESLYEKLKEWNSQQDFD